MDKEVVRNLCRWMSHRHDIELGHIRVGKNQKTTRGSATLYYDNRQTNISISTYVTNSGDEYWDTHRKVGILNTIIHEFTHLYFHKNKIITRHGKVWVDKYYHFLLEDWKDLVEMYNLLAADVLSSEWKIMLKHNDSRYFNITMFVKMIENNKDNIDYSSIVEDVIKRYSRNWIQAIKQLQKYGMNITIGNECLIASKNQYKISLLIQEDKSIRIGEYS